MHNDMHKPTPLGVSWGSVGGALGGWYVLVCQVVRHNEEDARICFIFTLDGIFFKTMQLHGATVTKTLKITHTPCGDFNLYWSLDAVNTLICVLSFNTSVL